MFELELSGVTATLEHLNTRTEKSGPEDVPAATLKISCAQSADILAVFGPELRDFLFEQGPQDLAGSVLVVRDPHLEYPIGTDREMTGAKALIEYGVGKPMQFDDVTVNEFRITPMDGGTVVLLFKVNFKQHDEHIQKLYKLQKKGITLTLVPAALPEMKDAA